MFKKSFAVLGGLTAAVLAFSPLAQAGPLNSITFSVTGWNGSTPGATSSSSTQQALPTNPLLNSLNYPTGLFVTGTATGMPNWYVPGGPTNTFGTFVGDPGGTRGTTNAWSFHNGGGLGTTLSTSSFSSATLMELTFTLANNMTMGTIVHDDGISIWNANNTSELVAGASAPTVSENTNFNLAAGTYNLFYVEANGAPSQLTFRNVTEAPEPGTLALFGAGLLGCALFIARRRRMTRSS